MDQAEHIEIEGYREVDRDADDVVGGGDEGPGSQRWIDVHAFHQDRNGGTDKSRKTDDQQKRSSAGKGHAKVLTQIPGHSYQHHRADEAV